MFIIIHVNDPRMKHIIYLLACAARCPMWTGQLIWSLKLTTLPWCTVGETRASRVSREPFKWHINSCGLISLDKQKYIRIKLMDECLFGHSIQIKVNNASQRTPFLASYINSQTCLLKGNENTKDYKLEVWTTKRVQPPPPIVSLHSRRDQQIRMENNRTDFSRRFWLLPFIYWPLNCRKSYWCSGIARFFLPLLSLMFLKLHSWLWRATKTSTCLVIPTWGEEKKILRGEKKKFSPPRVANSLLSYQLLMCNYTWVFIYMVPA